MNSKRLLDLLIVGLAVLLPSATVAFFGAVVLWGLQDRTAAAWLWGFAATAGGLCLFDTVLLVMWLAADRRHKDPIH